MYLVAIAWFYVALMMALAEAVSSQGSILGAIVTFLLYGLLPISIVLYVMGAPRRRDARRRAEQAQQQSSPPSAQGDRGDHSAAEPLASKREEP
jgi:membrane protein implicated in regulation of membrane protease activity